jgi:hypothetical protein
MPTESDKLYQFDDINNKTYKFEAMLSDPETRVIVRAIVSESIVEGVKAHCRIPISGNECQQLRFFFDGVRHLGDGDIHAGMEEAIRNHQHMKQSRNRFARLSERVGAAVLITIFGGLVACIYKGFKFFWAQP